MQSGRLRTLSQANHSKEIKKLIFIFQLKKAKSQVKLMIYIKFTHFKVKTNPSRIKLQSMFETALCKNQPVYLKSTYRFLIASIIHFQCEAYSLASE